MPKKDATAIEHYKELVRVLADEVINNENLALLDQVCSDRLAAELRRWFAPFRVGVPDWHQEIVELVAEGVTVVARCRCRGTNRGEWLGVAATGRSMEVDEVWFFRVAEGRLDRMWSLEDTWAGSCSSEPWRTRSRPHEEAAGTDGWYEGGGPDPGGFAGWRLVDGYRPGARVVSPTACAAVVMPSS